MKLAVVGSRSFNNKELLFQRLKEIKDIDLIISGGAKGADQLAEEFAAEFNIPLKVYYPNWKLHGKSAGMIRNKRIIDESDIVIAFWDEKSPGTKNVIKYSNSIKKKMEVWCF